MSKTFEQTNPSDVEKLFHDTLYYNLIHNGYTPKQAEKEINARLTAKIRENNKCTEYTEKLKGQLEALPDDSIILIETVPEKAFEVGMALVKFFSDKTDAGIIVSASRPYTSLINIFSKRFIDAKKMTIVDCVSKKNGSDFKDKNVLFIDNMSALTDISISINQCIQRSNGKKKFVFFDSIPTMIIHNKPKIFARFIHGVLTMMRLNGVCGILVSFTEENNKEIRADIIQMCDKVIKI